MERSTYQWQLHATALRPWMSLNIVIIKYHLSSRFLFFIFRPFFLPFYHLGHFTRKTTISPFLGGPAATNANKDTKLSQYSFSSAGILVRIANTPHIRNPNHCAKDSMSLAPNLTTFSLYQQCFQHFPLSCKRSCIFILVSKFNCHFDPFLLNTRALVQKLFNNTTKMSIPAMVNPS